MALKTSSSRWETPLLYRNSTRRWMTGILVTSVVWGSVALCAQQPDNPGAGSEAVLRIPAPLGGTAPKVVPTSVADTQNVVSGGVALGVLYDDNSLNLGQDGYQYSISPSIGFQQTRPHTAWDLDYHGGLIITRADGRSQTQNATAATADLQHMFSRRLMLELRQDYLLTNNPFSHLGEGLSPSAPSAVGQVSPALAATEIAGTSFAGLTYQLTRHSSIGLSGNFSTQRFRDVTSSAGNPVGLIDSRTMVGRGFYALQATEHQEIGAEYQVQDLHFDGAVARTVDQTLFLFDEVSIKTNMTLTLFAGPDRAHTHNNILILGTTASELVVPLVNDAWSPTGGATFLWRGKNVALRLSGTRAITQGSGSTGAIRATNARAELRRDFAKRWAVSLAYTYSDGRLLEGLANNFGSTITLEQADVTVDRRLKPNLLLRAQYSRIQQLTSGAVVPYNTGNHNRVGLEVRYEFTRPVGR